MPQTSITTDPVRGVPGMHSRPFETDDIESHVISQVGGILYGVYVTRQGDNKIKLPTSQAEIEDSGIGIMLRDPSAETPATAGTAPNSEVVAVIRHGYAWVFTETVCTQEGKVYARITASGGNTQLGAFRNDADSGNAILVPRARFKTTETAAGLAEVEVW
jgi:hypothetical protein